jgi:phage-related tail fiber protein
VIYRLQLLARSAPYHPALALEVNVDGSLDHTNSATAGTYTKVTIDSEGHVTTGTTLGAGDIPDLDASEDCNG